VIGAEPFVENVSVSSTKVRVARSGLLSGVVVALPSPVHAFIRAFDAGHYPELVDTRRADPPVHPATVED
jgi:hypothetical protein